jgi:hypothetical protein
MSLTSAIPRKKKLRSKLQLLKRGNEHLRVENTNLREQPLTCTKEQFQELCFKMFPPELTKFISIQFQLSNRLLHVRRYSKEFKLECLQLYFARSKLYKKQMKEKFCLPSPSTLCRFIRNLQVSSGLENNQLWERFSVKIQNFPERDRLCVLCMDELSLKAN